MFTATVFCVWSICHNFPGSPLKTSWSKHEHGHRFHPCASHFTRGFIGMCLVWRSTNTGGGRKAASPAARTGKQVENKHSTTVKVKKGKDCSHQEHTSHLQNTVSGKVKPSQSHCQELKPATAGKILRRSRPRRAAELSWQKFTYNLVCWQQIKAKKLIKCRAWFDLV